MDIIFRRTIRNEIDYDSDEMLYISKEAKDLLMKLMTSNPQARIPIKDALNHPWITQRNKKVSV